MTYGESKMLANAITQDCGISAVVVIDHYNTEIPDEDAEYHVLVYFPYGEVEFNTQKEIIKYFGYASLFPR